MALNVHVQKKPGTDLGIVTSMSGIKKEHIGNCCECCVIAQYATNKKSEHSPWVGCEAWACEADSVCNRHRLAVHSSQTLGLRESQRDIYLQKEKVT